MPSKTVLVRGRGGALFVMDMPSPGSLRREHVDAQLAAGDLVEVDNTARVAVDEPAAGQDPPATGDRYPADPKPRSSGRRTPSSRS